MKKILYILSIALLGAVSCKNNILEDINTNPEGKVTIRMSVILPEAALSTRGVQAEQPIIDDIYVATFGTEHYLNDYVKAVPCAAPGSTETVTDYSGVTNGVPFYFTVSLTATQTPRYVHIIANGPEHLDYNTYEDEIMKNLVTSGDNGAYWTYVVLPNGTANADGTVSQDAKTRLSGLQLIRNFAMVDVKVDPSLGGENPTFTLTGYEVFNKPENGSIAVWNQNVLKEEGAEPDAAFEKPEKGATESDEHYAATVAKANRFRAFFPNYHAKTWSELNATEGNARFYNPFTPDFSINPTVPSSTGTYTNAPKFLFERPGGESVTDDKGAYIILKGRYKNDAAETFYRLDFEDADGNYLPILRNFKYTITLTKVLKRGLADPAQTTADNANVSSKAETQNLADLADGQSRIYVEWLDNIYSDKDGDIQTFKYKYLEDATNESSRKKAEITPSYGSNPAIDKEYGLNQSSTPDANGWYTVTFKKTKQENGVNKVSSFRVTGVKEEADGQKQKLYRDIKVYVLPIQSWVVSDPTYGTQTVGSVPYNTVSVTVTLPEGLPMSAFPLKISFEDRNKTLNPLGIDMPAEVNKSIVPGNSNTSYQFVKSVLYSEYTSKTATNPREVVCTFKRLSNGPTELFYTSPLFATTGNSKTVTELN